MSNPFNLRFATLLVALPVAVLAGSFVSGCGGGGSSGGGPSTPAPPGVLLFDDFSGSSLNRNQWGVYGAGAVLQRTGFGSTPKLLTEGNTTFAQLELDTYNRFNSGKFLGTEIYTLKRYPVGNGLEIETRLRGPITQPGIVFAFFAIYDRGNTPASYLKDEIDYEFLTAELEQYGTSNRLYLNIWNDWNEKYGYDLDNNADSTRLHDDKTYFPVGGFNWKNWNTYKIRWFPDRTEFYLNGALQRTEREVRPDQAMSVHFNIWSSDSSFNQAYSNSFDPTNAAGSRKFSFDVDYVKVTQLGSTTTSASSLPNYEIPSGTTSLRNR